MENTATVSTEPKLPVLNLEMLTDLVTWAIADEKKVQHLAERFADWGPWDQSNWARNGMCGTAYCLAGQAVTQVGYMPVFTEGDNRAYSCAPKIFDGLTASGKPSFIPDPKVEPIAISELAREVLGLTQEESSSLFHGENDIATITLLAITYANVRSLEIDLPDEAYTAMYDRWDSLAAGRRDIFERFYFPESYQDLANGIERCQHCGQEIKETEAVPF